EREYYRANMARNEQKIVDKNILGSLFKTAAIVYGFYQLLNLSVFKGNDFRNKNLSEEQIEAMDVHNEHHHMESLVDLVECFGHGLIAGLSIAPAEIEKAKKTNLAESNKILDSDVAELPPPLNHRHTE
ncbi:MAG: hypothetical protein AAB876_03145, partial [Patescibacteria group bacterium]